jgi:lysine/arginine/ornithine transport system substrate-binding protein
MRALYEMIFAMHLRGLADCARMSLQNAVQADVGFLRTPRGKDFEFAGDPLYDAKTLGSGTAIGLRKEDADLQAKIDKAIADTRADGTYDRIAKKYFDFDVYGQ